MTPISFNNAIKEIQDSDLLLWRNAFGYYHASKLAWWGDDCFVMDTHWSRGGDIRLLQTDVKNYSGWLDWFGLCPTVKYDRDGAINFMREHVDHPYGFGNVACAALLHLRSYDCSFQERLMMARSTNVRHFVPNLLRELTGLVVGTIPYLIVLTGLLFLMS